MSPSFLSMVLVENFVSENLDPQEYIPAGMISEAAQTYIDTAV
jgi:hypothetical protein